MVEFRRGTWSVCNKGITQFCLSPTHDPFLVCTPSRRTSPPFGWYSFRLPTKGWPGWVDLDGWLHTGINVMHRKFNPDTVTHRSTNRARRRSERANHYATPLPIYRITYLSQTQLFFRSATRLIYLFIMKSYVKYTEEYKENTKKNEKKQMNIYWTTTHTTIR